jgi:hypothetical protein
MKLYILNEYIGGTPFDSNTRGAFRTLDEAKKEMQNVYESDYLNFLNYEVSEDDHQKDDLSFYYDVDDFWGGCVIEEIELK